MKRVSTNQLLTELGKYGTLKIRPVSPKMRKEGYILRCDYRPHFSFDYSTTMSSVHHNTDDIRDFLEIAAHCFEDGFSPIFDHIQNQKKWD